MVKLKSFNKTIKDKLEDKSDTNTAHKSIKDRITNIDARDKRTMLQRMGSGTRSQTTGK